MKLHRDLDLFEIEEFKKWAHDNYEPLSPIKGVWHPIVQAECVKINQTAEIFPTTKEEEACPYESTPE